MYTHDSHLWVTCGVDEYTHIVHTCTCIRVEIAYAGMDNANTTTGLHTRSLMSIQLSNKLTTSKL